MKSHELSMNFQWNFSDLITIWGPEHLSDLGIASIPASPDWHPVSQPDFTSSELLKRVGSTWWWYLQSICGNIGGILIKLLGLPYIIFHNFCGWWSSISCHGDPYINYCKSLYLLALSIDATFPATFFFWGPLPALTPWWSSQRSQHMPRLFLAQRSGEGCCRLWWCSKTAATWESQWLLATMSDTINDFEWLLVTFFAPTSNYQWHFLSPYEYYELLNDSSMVSMTSSNYYP